MVKKLKLKGADPVFLTFHLLFLGITYCIYLVPYISPSIFPYLGYIAILYPVLVIANIVLILVLFWRNKNMALIFLILSIGLYKPFSKSYRVLAKKPNMEADLKVLSYNVNGLSKDGFRQFFEEHDADVVLIQEAQDVTKLSELRESVFGSYYYERYYILHVFSKYPILEFKQFLDRPVHGESGQAAFADIAIGNDTIRFITMHLESMRVPKELVKGTTKNIDSAQRNSKIINNKLTRGFLLHEKQLKKVTSEIRKSKHPVIVTGDMNAVPYSYEYKQITNLLKDPYPEVGFSSGITFDEYKYPIRIDYIFHSDELKPISYEVIDSVKLSDHYPVVATFKLP